MYLSAESEQLKDNYNTAQSIIEEKSVEFEKLNEEMQQLKKDYESVQEQNICLKSGEEESTNILANLKEQIASNNEQVSSSKLEII